MMVLDVAIDSVPQLDSGIPDRLLNGQADPRNRIPVADDIKPDLDPPTHCRR